MEIGFFWIISQIIIAVVIIGAINYIYNFFKNNLTVPKIKDLVKKPKQQYKHIYDSILESKKEKENKKLNMKSELKDYINELSKGKIEKNNNPEQLGNSMFSNNNNNNNNFSNF